MNGTSAPEKRGSSAQPLAPTRLFPVWEGGTYGEAEILASCYRRSLQVADQLGARTIAFPAIATGVYGFPAAQAARIAVDTIRSTPTAIDTVRLVAFDEATRDLLAAALDDEAAS